jgi:hypothetical protein
LVVSCFAIVYSRRANPLFLNAGESATTRVRVG